MNKEYKLDDIADLSLISSVDSAAAHFQGKTNILRRIAALRAFDIDARLGEIACPTLVYATRDDLLVPYSRSQRLAAGLPDAVLHLDDFGAHAVNVTAADHFNAVVLEFLGKAGPVM